MAEKKFIRTCSIWRALETVGDTPTLLIIESSWLGARRFDDFRRRTGLLKALLSSRLKQLVAAKVFKKVPYSDSPKRYEYRVTQKGRALYWTSLMMLRWERRWGNRDGKINIVLRHKTCGNLFDPTPSCKSCHGEVVARDVDWEEGPGVGWMAATYSRRRRQRDLGGSEARTTLMDEVAQLTGDRWSSLILRSVFTGLRKFDEIRKDTAIATNILSERLSWLVNMDVLEPHAYSTSPQRFEYRLTEKGIDYYPVLLMLMQWGDSWYAAPEGPPLILQHRPCGNELQTEVTCSACGEPIDPKDVEFTVEEAAGASDDADESIREAS